MRKSSIGVATLAALMAFMTACSNGGNNNANSGASGGSEASGTAQAATESASAAKQETVTIKVFHANTGTLPSNVLDNPVMDEIEQRIGVKLEFVNTGGNQDEANQRLATLIATNDLPDLIITGDMNINKLLLKNDMITPLDDLIAQYGSDLTANVKEGLDYSKLMYSEGKDNLYFVPGLIGDESFYPMGYDLVFQIRGDLLEQSGLGELKSLDDLIAYGKKAQELEPTNAEGQKTYLTGIPFADSGGWDYVDWNTSHNDGFAGVGGFNYLDIEKNELVPRFTDENNSFWKAMSFWNKAYREGLLDPESATMKAQQVQDKGKALRYHLGLANWQIGWPNDVIRGSGDTVKGFIPTLLDAKANNTFFRFSSPVGNNMLWSIAKGSKKQEAVMKFMNFAASWDGVELMWNGPEGKLWSMDNGVPKTLPVDPNVPSDPDAAKKVGNAYMAPNFIINGKPINADKGWKVKYGDNAPERYVDSMTTPEKKYIEDNGLNYPTQIFETRENYSVNTSLIDPVKPDPNSDVALLEQKIKTYLDMNIARVIFSKDDAAFETAKTKFIGELNDMGIEQVMAFYKEGFDANKTKLSALQ
ncbi:type 2 periplasmic-binding domain-containing protein [Cohnella fermenti]|uniref:Extracellular solute-binding protein n=1 Tax=Cohnella fermenti TaxID=2565925 RepID=A0A4S4BJE6_9BACL|nr:extracellular solute-binding protein [Cohnella fermenti]THF73794.1 extracellular solute-binding protein [Cohnella fermenti]